MEITDVRIKLVKHSKERLKAFCTITLDSEFVVRDIKIVEGANGLFVAMPSRKLAVPCPGCRHKVHLRARFCDECGRELPAKELPADEDGRTKLYTDVAHPITQAFRDKLQRRVVEGYEAECKRVADEHVEADDQETNDALETHDALNAGGAPDTPDTPAAGDAPDTHDALDDDDFGSMVAGLKGDGRDRWSETATAASSIEGRTPSSARSEEGSDRGKRRRRGRRRGRSGEERRAVEDRPSSMPQETPTAEPSETAPPDSVIFPDTEDESRPRESPVRADHAPKEEKAAPYTSEETTPPPADEVSLDEAAAEPPVSEDEREDSTPFGVGII